MSVSPLAIQAGIVTEQEIYQLFRDKYKASDLDPDKYLVRPPSYGPTSLAEEPLVSIMRGDPVVGTTLEAPEEHALKLQQFVQSPKVGLVNPANLPLLEAWAERVQGLVRQRQQLMASANMMGGGRPEGGGAPPVSGASEDINATAPVQDNEMLDKGNMQ